MSAFPRRESACIVMLMALVCVAAPADAGPRFELDETGWFSIGTGLRSSFNAVEKAAPSGATSENIAIDNWRIYLNGQVHEMITFQVNTDRDRAENDVRLLDGMIRLELNESVHLWGGRQKVPINRSNLNSIFNIIAWDRLDFLQFPHEFLGRDDGVSIWGTAAESRLKYYAAVFDGAPDRDDDLLYVGRVAYNFLDPEPGYTVPGSYHGQRDILSVGASVLSENGNTAWTGDLFLERPLGRLGLPTLESGYFRYNALANNTNVNVAGDGYYVLGAYMFPPVIGIGRFQPYIRHQDREFNPGDGTRLDIGMNYIIDGHNARINVQWARDDGRDTPGRNIQMFRIGLQVQI